jgi:transposase
MESWRHRGSTPTSCVSGRLRWRWRPVATRHQARALARIGKQLGINPETLQNWVPQAEIDEGTRAGTATSDAERITALERENAELRRANEILKTASAFFAQAELDRRLR